MSNDLPQEVKDAQAKLAASIARVVADPSIKATDTMDITPDMADESRLRAEREAFEHAQAEVIDSLNEETATPGNPDKDTPPL